MYFSDALFELLVRKVPAAVLKQVPAALFPEANSDDAGAV